jgi:hypothetical protein
VQRAWSEIMNALANAKRSVGRWNLNFVFEARALYTPIPSCRLIQNKQRTNCEATEVMARKKLMYVLKIGSSI